MITIKQLAEICGVSRGTVDRVLNNRGNVKPEKRELILRKMKELNYQRDPVGKALAAKRKHPVLAVLIAASEIPFFEPMIHTMQKESRKYSRFGLKIIWKLLKGYDIEQQAQALDELRPQVNAIIISPINDSRIVRRLNACIDDGIFVVTLNNDIEQAKRHYYVGSDYTNGGETAAALLQMIGPKQLRVGIALGSRKILGHQQRLAGFQHILRDDPNCRILDIAETRDDDFAAYDAILRMMQAHPDLNSLFLLSSGGAYGAGRALKSLERNDMTIVAFDTTPPIIELMRRRIIRAALYQHPRQQGQRAMLLAYDYLINGIEPEHEQYIIKNEIRILQNL